MIGAIAGDIIGSVYEHHPIKTKDFPLFHPQCHFTDDTVLTIAIAKAIPWLALQEALLKPTTDLLPHVSETRCRRI